MSDGVKETCCTNCSHLAVCKYKEDFLNIYETVSNASIHKKYPVKKQCCENYYF